METPLHLPSNKKKARSNIASERAYACETRCLEEGRKAAGAVADGFGVDIHSVEQGEEQVVERGVLRERAVESLL